MKIDNNKSGDLGLWIAIQENNLTESAFIERMLNEQALTPDELAISCLETTIDGSPKEVLLILGEHALQRGVERKSIFRDDLIRKIKRSLNKAVLSRVMAHSVFEENRELHPYEGDGIDSTVVVDARTGLTLALQAGGTYVFVRTVWASERGRFRTSPSNEVVCISKAGEITVKRGGNQS